MTVIVQAMGGALRAGIINDLPEIKEFSSKNENFSAERIPALRLFLPLFRIWSSWLRFWKRKLEIWHTLISSG